MGQSCVNGAMRAVYRKGIGLIFPNRDVAADGDVAEFRGSVEPAATAAPPKAQFISGQESGKTGSCHRQRALTVAALIVLQIAPHRWYSSSPPVQLLVTISSLVTLVDSLQTALHNRSWSPCSPGEECKAQRSCNLGRPSKRSLAVATTTQSQLEDLTSPSLQPHVRCRLLGDVVVSTRVTLALQTKAPVS